MTASLSPVAPAVAPVQRENQPAGAAPHPAVPLADAVSAQAVRPVQGPGRVADARLHTGRDRPVGPPPAFDINVLQDLRERQSAIRTDRTDDQPDTPRLDRKV